MTRSSHVFDSVPTYLESRVSRSLVSTLKTPPAAGILTSRPAESLNVTATTSDRVMPPPTRYGEDSIDVISERTGSVGSLASPQEVPPNMIRQPPCGLVRNTIRPASGDSNTSRAEASEASVIPRPSAIFRSLAVGVTTGRCAIGPDSGIRRGLPSLEPTTEAMPNAAANTTATIATARRNHGLEGWITCLSLAFNG